MAKLRICVSLNPDEVAFLDKYAGERGIGRSEALRYIIQHYRLLLRQAEVRI
jgi:metal-responsive CopG/Arc/MetJ family transcriptional regulator